jgi:hypothetical protein
VQDFALFPLDIDVQVVAWYARTEPIYGYKGDEASNNTYRSCMQAKIRPSSSWMRN